MHHLDQFLSLSMLLKREDSVCLSVSHFWSFERCLLSTALVLRLPQISGVLSWFNKNITLFMKICAQHNDLCIRRLPSSLHGKSYAFDKMLEVFQLG